MQDRIHEIIRSRNRKADAGTEAARRVYRPAGKKIGSLLCALCLDVDQIPFDISLRLSVLSFTDDE